MQVQLGDPRKTGKDANVQIAEAFGNLTYPLTATVQNHMPRDLSFPEVQGLFLRHVASATGTSKTVTITSYDLLQRLASSINQIAALNNCALAVTISVGEATAAAPVETPAETPATPVAAATSIPADPVAPVDSSVKKPSDGLSYNQLMDALRLAGIEFAVGAKKSDLAALLDNAATIASTTQTPV